MTTDAISRRATIWATQPCASSAIAVTRLCRSAVPKGTAWRGRSSGFDPTAENIRQSLDHHGIGTRVLVTLGAVTVADSRQPRPESRALVYRAPKALAGVPPFEPKWMS